MSRIIENCSLSFNCTCTYLGYIGQSGGLVDRSGEEERVLGISNLGQRHPGDVGPRHISQQYSRRINTFPVQASILNQLSFYDPDVDTGIKIRWSSLQAFSRGI
jgi:hypothetical protein